ncbi:hypothetical protein KTS45_18705 [Halomicroarcula limicola]|uniref:DUF7509 domain-containing protein n=1 Tax=Haloarcula limicola TaxID=1429915 RepID=A0A8J7Y8W4_9EURY|nr:hypothetical protein [Halomicroarcula limicola]MBV0926242.1 hypothetical protein [Halomicroarcula limicola]
MHDRLLGELAHSRFLIYLIVPYKTFDALQTAAENDDGEMLSSIPETVDLGALVGSDEDLDQQEAVLDLLLYARDRLRTDPAVNALALDIDISLKEMDAATQSIEFALASNAVIYIVPRIGNNLGVNIETGSVLEA